MARSRFQRLCFLSYVSLESFNDSSIRIRLGCRMPYAASFAAPCTRLQAVPDQTSDDCQCVHEPLVERRRIHIVRRFTSAGNA